MSTTLMKAYAGLVSSLMDLPDGTTTTIDSSGYAAIPYAYVGAMLNSGWSIAEGEFSTGTEGYGVALLRDSLTKIFGVYGDDGGAVLWGTGSVPDIKGSISRVLLTKDDTGGFIRVHGLMGQLKGYDAFWNDEVVSAVYGRMEIVRSAASVVLGGHGVSAAMLGVVATSGTMTVDTNHILAGVAAISDFRATLTQTGKTVAFFAGKYDTTNWSDSTTRTTWAYGLYVPVGVTGQAAIQLGDKSSTVGYGVTVNAAPADGSGIAGILKVYGDLGGVVPGNTVDINAIESRFLIASDCSAASFSVKANRGHLRVHGGKLPSSAQCSGLAGYIEIDGVSAIGTSSINAAVSAMVDASGTVTGAANSVLSAFAAYSGGLTLGTARSTVLHIPGSAPFGSLLDFGSGSSFYTASGLTGSVSAAGIKVVIDNTTYILRLYPNT